MRIVPIESCPFVSGCRALADLWAVLRSIVLIWSDFEKPKSLYWDARELLNQSGSSIVYALADHIDAHDAAVGGFVPDGARETGGGRATERLWLTG